MRISFERKRGKIYLNISFLLIGAQKKKTFNTYLNPKHKKNVKNNMQKEETNCAITKF